MQRDKPRKYSGAGRLRKCGDPAGYGGTGPVTSTGVNPRAYSGADPAYTVGQTKKNEGQNWF